MPAREVFLAPGHAVGVACGAGVVAVLGEPGEREAGVGVELGLLAVEHLAQHVVDDGQRGRHRHRRPVGLHHPGHTGRTP